MFYLSSLSSAPKFIPSFYLSDKLIHGIEYAIFGALVFHAIKDSPRTADTTRKIVILSILIVIFYGISDEFHQSYVPSRDASFFDFVADVVGGSIGIFLTLAWKTRKRDKKLPLETLPEKEESA